MPYVNTKFGKIKYKKVGVGPALIVFNGGPGMEYSYLYGGLEPLSKFRTLFFFNQYGCDGDSNFPESATFDLTVEHALCFVNEIKKDHHVLGVVGHSNGVKIGLHILEKLSELEESIFLNPGPLTNELWQKCMPNRNISVEDRAILSTLAEMKSAEANLAMIELFGHYDIQNHPPQIPVHYKAFDYNVCEKVQESMGDYDLRYLVDYIPRKSLLILGENDFIYRGYLLDIEENCSKTFVISDTKHMPINEKPEEFEKIVADFYHGIELGSLEQQNPYTTKSPIFSLYSL